MLRAIEEFRRSHPGASFYGFSQHRAGGKVEIEISYVPQGRTERQAVKYVYAVSMEEYRN